MTDAPEVRKDWVAAHWEVFWTIFHGQDRLTTFRRIVALGLSRRDAAELILEHEREPA